MKINNITISVMQGDITACAADVLVLPVDTSLVMRRGIAAAIKRKGGKSIEAQAIRMSPLCAGEVCLTDAGKLKVRALIHAVTAGAALKTDEIKIRNAAGNCLRAAQQLKMISIVFPSLGYGLKGVSPLACAKIMAQEVYRYIRQENEPSLKKITFCLPDKETFDAFERNMFGYLDYIVNKLKSPFVTVDAIIELKEGIVIIKRSNPPFGWALPGGFVDYGESLEKAAAREAKEETGLDLYDVKQFHTYSDPCRDPRFHTIGTVFTARAIGVPRAGDDAAGVKVVPLRKISALSFAFDHKKIILDYIRSKKTRS
jgi:8-oxo-dGTP diphosphatase